MAIQQIVPINFNLQGDGVSTTFKYTLSSMFALLFDDAGYRIVSSGTVPTNMTARSTFGIPITAAMVSGKMQLTFQTAPPVGVVGGVTVLLAFNSQ